METIRKQGEGDGYNRVGTSLTERIAKLESQTSFKDAKDFTDKEKKKLPWVGKFKRTFNKNPKTLQDKVIVLCFNSKRELEEPVILPIISGGLIVYKDKGFQFDPSALYTIKLGNKMNKLLVIEEDDRLPVGNRYRQLKSTDIEELKKQGRYTFNDGILLKMLWNAQIEKMQKKAGGNYILWIVLGLIGLAVVYMFMK